MKGPAKGPGWHWVLLVCPLVLGATLGGATAEQLQARGPPIAVGGFTG